MTYYARPGRLAPGVEDAIVGCVLGLVPASFRATKKTPRPLSLEEARASFVLADPALDVELVACEPAILDPVAVDFDLEGRVWVAEMRDYPSGMDGALKPGGAIRCLEDVDGDGFYETSTAFLRDVPFPTGVAVYRDGILVAAAPDLLFARDTDGDLVADETKVLFTGFPTHNEQARVNSLQIGLDGWWYAASGLFGAEISRADGTVVCDTSGRDFRFRPDTLELEPVAGLSQHGRIRDDFGEWFGCDSGTLAWHFPLREEVLARNPYVLPPSPRVSIANDPDATRVFPVASFVERFNEPESVGHLTAGCGNTFYRDVKLGDEYAGDMFVCEPAYNLVTRLELERTGTTFAAHRAPRERDREFLASSDPWFRPVQAVTAPDGSLWILDMYRRVIEHPRWIPPERLAELDVRAGWDKGRIWRVVRRGEGGPLPRLEGLPPAELAHALETSNGTLRDHVLERLVARSDHRACDGLRAVLEHGFPEAARVAAIAALEELRGLAPKDIETALAASAPHLRRTGVEMSARWGFLYFDLEQFQELVRDADASVRMEVGSFFAQLGVREAGNALARILLMKPRDPYIEAACLAGAPQHLEALCAAALGAHDAPETVLRSLASTAAGMHDATPVIAWLQRLLAPDSAELESRIHSAAVLFEALEASDWDWKRESKIEEASSHLGPFFADALRLALDPEAPVDARCDALEVTACDRSMVPSDVLGRFVTPDAPPELAARAIDLIQRGDEDGKFVLQGLVGNVGPTLRARIVSAMLTRESWTTEILEAASDPVIAGTFDLAQRQRLRVHESPEIRALAEKAFGERPSPARAEVVTRLVQRLGATGDAALGKEVFTQQCSKCHRLDGNGNAVGPDLAAVTDRSNEALLQSILDPNRAVLDAYVVHAVEMYGGEQYEGIVSEETATGLVLTGSDGVPRRILRGDIANIRFTRVSLMPEGFELLIDDAGFANLLAYLRPARESRKVAAGNQPVRVEAASDGSVLLEARTAEIYGADIVFEGAPFQNLGYWSGPLDRAEWVVEIPSAGEYTVGIEWACAPDSAGNPWVLEVAGERLDGIVPSTGGWDRYEHADLGRLHLEPGERRVILRPGREPEGALMDLRALVLVRSGS
jgi:putative membrane-bound dehydrogenase-like protein